MRPRTGRLVQALEQVTYMNGDICQYMDITFRCRAVGGEARVNDDESLEVGWFTVDALPELNEFACSGSSRHCPT